MCCTAVETFVRSSIQLYMRIVYRQCNCYLCDTPRFLAKRTPEFQKGEDELMPKVHEELNKKSDIEDRVYLRALWAWWRQEVHVQRGWPDMHQGRNRDYNVLQ